MSASPEQSAQTTERLNAEASAVGLVLVGSGKSSTYRTYKCNTCGTVREYLVQNVRMGRVSCDTCITNVLQQEANDFGYELIGNGRSYDVKTYRCKACSDVKERSLYSIRNKSCRCDNCVLNARQKEANDIGLELIGDCVNKSYRKYRWIECGHEYDYQIAHVKKGVAICRECNNTAWIAPSNIYILHFKADDGFEWLKFGIAKNIDGRLSTYRLMDNVNLISRVSVIPFETGRLAREKEKSIHKKLQAYKIDKDVMSNYMKNGFTECYPLNMLTQLIESINNER